MYQHDATREATVHLVRALARRVLLCAFVVGVAAACGDSATRPDEFSDPSVPLRVGPGEEFALRLESNVTTGFAWRLARPVDGVRVVLLDSAYEAPQSDLIGASGAEVWRFRAVDRGQTTVALEYVRPFEPDTTPARTAEFTVVVD